MKYIHVVFLNGVVGYADSYTYTNDVTLNLEIGSIVLVGTKSGMSLAQVIHMSDDSHLSYEPKQVLADLTGATSHFEELVINAKREHIKAQLEYEVEKAKEQEIAKAERDELMNLAKVNPAISELVTKLDKLK